MEHYKESIDTFNKLASGYQEKFMDVQLYNDSYDRFIKLIEQPNAKILDVGCGPGNISRYLLSKQPEYKILGIDLAPNMIELAKKNNPTAEYKVMDCLRLNALNEKFDGIICGFCMPYLSKEDCSKLISQSVSALNKNGILYLSVIEDDPLKSGFEMSSTGEARAYVYYHEERYLVDCIHENSLRLVDTIRVGYTKGDGTVQVHLILIASNRSA
jgi:2-polyprenyl-3-methyl-5-hydroxy-6-metoxy-1,4-benzoquinol methylase